MSLLTSTNPKKAFGVLKPSPCYIPPSAVIEEAVVMTLGANKYGPFNWNESPVDATTYYSAALRHMFSWFTGEDNDPESGASHLAHARACCGILIDALATGTLIDDRPKKTASAADAIKRLEIKPKPAPDPFQDLRDARTPEERSKAFGTAPLPRDLTDEEFQRALQDDDGTAYHSFGKPISPTGGVEQDDAGGMHPRSFTRGGHRTAPIAGAT